MGLCPIVTVMVKKQRPKLKAYMGYSREGGPQEGALLIFAHSVKEAKRVGYSTIMSLFTDEYTDVAVKWMGIANHLFEQNWPWSKKLIERDIPHVVDSPISCKICELWGDELNEEGICESCEADLDD